MLNIKDISLYNKRVLIRSDLNVPIKNNKVLSDIKIIYSLSTIKYAIKSGAFVIICSHLGNPDKDSDEFSLFPIVKILEKKLKIKVNFVKNYLNGISFNKKEIFLLENVRFNKGEKENCPILSEKYSNLCDVFVMDAFASSHRIHSSTYGIIKFAKISCSGLLLLNEFNSLNKIILNHKKPLISIVGGSKISNKLKLLKSLSNISNKIFVGGGIANTLLYYKGFNIGNSLFEKKLIIESKEILKNIKIILPIDVRVKNYKNKSVLKNLNELNDNDTILDIGRKTINNIKNEINISKTLLWSGPIGMFELKDFSIGTKLIFESIKNNKKLFSVMGGGDTLFSLIKFNFLNKVSYFSTGGGAFLKFIENRNLPIFEELSNKKK